MTKNTPKNGAELSLETIVTHSGRSPENHFGFVNTPVYRGSTIVFRTVAELDDYGAPYRYGRNDNPTVNDVCSLISELEGATGTVLAPSGLGAISTALLSLLETGDEVLVTDSAYEPTRIFCAETLARMGITTRFYDPRLGADIASVISEKTKVIWVESPGSLTFEVQDLPGIAAAAHARGVAVVVDNSWASPLFHHPLQLGADLVVHAGTKMFVGHSDCMIGTISANETYWPKLKRTHRLLGVYVSPDDAFLMARGIRTLALRMKEHNQRSTELAHWLRDHPLVEQVYHPALPDNQDHPIWKRDFSGAGSLFAFRLADAPRSAIAAMLDNMSLFAMGYSWGGFESLCIPFDPRRVRTAAPFTAPGNMFRIHVGFEGMDDLKADLAAGLERYMAARG